MCGAEPLVSAKSTESVDAFYKLLGEREGFTVSTPASISPRWPAARNDHYCAQDVCRHAVLDLSPLRLPSDSDSDVQTPDGDISSTHCDTYSPVYPRLADEYAAESPQANHEQYSPHGSYDDQDLQNSQIHPTNIDSRARAPQQELDGLHVSYAESHFGLQEQLIDLAEFYRILSLDYDRMARKYDSLRHLVCGLVAQQSAHAEALVALNEWRTRIQKSFAEVQVQGQDPELLFYGTPHSTSTVDITTEQVEPIPIEAGSAASMMTDRRDSGVADLETPLVTPETPPEKHVVRPHLVLKLTPQPDDEQGLVKPTSGSAPHQHERPKRTRKPTEKRKAAELEAESKEKKAKKKHS